MIRMTNILADTAQDRFYCNLITPIFSFFSAMV